MKDEKQLKTIAIEITTLCNSKCVFCPHGTNDFIRKKTTMSNELFFHLVDICKKENIPNVSIGGIGEFLLDKDLFSKTQYIVDSDLTFSNFTTNASLLNEIISQKLIDSGLKQIVFSIDSVDKESYESIRVGLNFDVVLKNILRFIELNQGKVKIIINAVVDKHRGKKFVSFRNVFEKYLADAQSNFSIAFYPMHNWANGRHHKFLKHKYCSRLFGNLAQIRVDGSMGLCCLDYNNVMSLGVVKDSFIDLWNSDMINGIRRLHKQGRWNEIELCNNCSQMYMGKKIRKINLKIDGK